MTYRNNDFESLPISEITTNAQTATSGDQITLFRSGTAKFYGTDTAGEVIFGSKSLKLVTASGEDGYGYWYWNGGVPAIGGRCAFRIPSVPTVSTDLLKVYGASTVISSVRLASDSKLYLKQTTGNVNLHISTALTFPTVFQIDVSIQPGVATIAPYDGKVIYAIYDINGNYIGGMTQPYEKTDANFGINTLTQYAWGRHVAQPFAWTIEMDAWRANDAYGLIGSYTATPPAPIADATEAEAYQIVGIVCAGNPTWTQIAGPTVSLSGSGGSVSFVAPAVTSSTTITFRATENALTGDVSVTINPYGFFSRQGNAWVGRRIYGKSAGTWK